MAYSALFKLERKRRHKEI